ncbi:lipase [Niabella ginsenosidivorans]|uniref:Lipase n=1 Tax=Niabella ginsenosidivorans TaxID=1176587 RepID=A0A1A9HWI9_9BACT|nr:SGNH/GDSL hydrolase family protein [Niabella ginsenosidivorans]ANH79757.1 lipase [Niabella ginsenosidivorans]
MKFFLCVAAMLLITQCLPGQVALPETYLSAIRQQLTVQWPKNKTINLVFHGHSVPGGYWNDHRVETLRSYPYQVLKALKEKYPYALINIIVTAKGGENSVDGQKRFADVLAHKPDVLFIDYALNDVGIGLNKAKKAWEQMIRQALAAGIKVVLLTPSPDQRIHLSDSANILEQHARQIRQLAAAYKTGLVDSYALFKNRFQTAGTIKPYMSWVNHPNEKGHLLIAGGILKYFDL